MTLHPRSPWNHSWVPWLSGQTCGRTSPHYAILWICDRFRVLTRKVTVSWIEILSCEDLPRLNFVAIDEVSNARLATFGPKVRKRIRHAVSFGGFSNSMSISRSSKEESDESLHGWIRRETAVLRRGIVGKSRSEIMRAINDSQSKWTDWGSSTLHLDLRYLSRFFHSDSYTFLRLFDSDHSMLLIEPLQKKLVECLNKWIVLFLMKLMTWPVSST